MVRCGVVSYTNVIVKGTYQRMALKYVEDLFTWRWCSSAMAPVVVAEAYPGTQYSTY